MGTEKKNIVLVSWIFQSRRFFFTVKFINTRGKLNSITDRHFLKSSLIALWNLLSFAVSQFATSLEPPALTFYNGTTISTWGVIINVNKYR